MVVVRHLFSKTLDILDKTNSRVLFRLPYKRVPLSIIPHNSRTPCYGHFNQVFSIDSSSLIDFIGQLK
ncbi:hypothetical protein COBT_002428 [Conglomerata obtusa]